jgi:hypothetical protein
MRHVNTQLELKRVEMMPPFMFDFAAKKNVEMWVKCMKNTIKVRLKGAESFFIEILPTEASAALSESLTGS